MNLEEEFLEITDFSLFPGKTNYIRKYGEIASKFEKQIHPEIKVKMLEYERDGYYNDHGIDHIKMVIERASQLVDNFMKADDSFKLSDYETFILLVAIHLHDSGHLLDERKMHTQKTHEMLGRFCSEQLDAPERMVIANIARAHGGKKDPIGQLKEGSVRGVNVRSKLLAAILRHADELADETERASNSLLQLEDQKKDPQYKHINEYSEIYHRYSQALHSVRISGSEIKLYFCVDIECLQRLFSKKDGEQITKNHYLLDEIYDRTEKTFLETLYCNRFFPANARFNVIKVEIALLEEYAIDFQTISYELVESGYPLVSNESLINRKDIDGATIATLIKKKKDEESI